MRVSALVAVSPPMRELLETIERVAASDLTVLIEGETGTGKELVAEAIHERSARCRGPFVVCDLHATSAATLDNDLFGREGASDANERERQGAFSRAEHGTLFLDEIGELETSAQPLLLRAIERH